jgi:hypothetical protein
VWFGIGIEDVSNWILYVIGVYDKKYVNNFRWRLLNYRNNILFIMK